jgi:hypothetical protein
MGYCLKDCMHIIRTQITAVSIYTVVETHHLMLNEIFYCRQCKYLVMYYALKMVFVFQVIVKTQSGKPSLWNSGILMT